MIELHVSPDDLLIELFVVVSGHHPRTSLIDHAEHKFDDTHRIGATIDQITDENSFAPVGMRAFKILRNVLYNRVRTVIHFFPFVRNG